MALFEHRTEERLDLHLYIVSPATIHTMEKIQYWDHAAQRDIAACEARIAELKQYQKMLYDRAQELAAANWHYELYLTREKSWSTGKVHYYLQLRKVYDAAGIAPEIIENRKYPGTERHQALKDFAAMQKARPGIVTHKDIEKSKWER